MAADISTSLKDWSTTEASNAPAGSTAISTNLDDNLRQLQSTVRDVWSRTTVASASTCDIGAVDHGSITISGTTTITSFGTVSEGIRKWLTFSGALTLTHNATSLILPGGASITTAAGDTACVESLGSGNWRCLAYQPATGRSVNTSVSLSDGTVSAPGLSFTSDSNTGIYRPSADAIALAAGGGQVALFDAVTSGLVFVTPNVTSGSALDISLTGGTTNVNNQYGGDIRLTGGASSGGSARGGLVVIAGGLTTSSSGGEVTITGGAGSGTGANGGDVTLTGGTANSSGDGGSVLLNTGGTSSGSIGAVVLQAAGDAAITVQGSTGHTHFGGLGAYPPVITSGAGTGASITGSDSAFEVTFGTSAGTTTRVTFGKTFTSTPLCFANYGASNIAVRCAPTTTYVDIVFASSPASSATLQVHCVGR